MIKIQIRRCKTCGETDEKKFYTSKKSMCKNCHNDAMKARTLAISNNSLAVNRRKAKITPLSVSYPRKTPSLSTIKCRCGAELKNVPSYLQEVVNWVCAKCFDEG